MKVILKEISKIEERDLSSILSLHQKYYCNVNKEKFRQDFKEKDNCLLAFNDVEELIGYSTLQLIQLDVDSKKITVLYSGDTLVDPDYWQYSLITLGFIKYLLKIQERYTELYWLLISKGHRTYRYLPTFFKDYYPACNVDTPLKAKKIMSAVCSKKFNDNFDAKRGLVFSRGKNDYLSKELAMITEARSKNPHVRYFVKKNPGYLQGDELVCLTDLRRDNRKEARFKKILAVENIKCKI